MNVMKWLLDSDPAIRWQVMRDLTDQDERVVTAERSRVAGKRSHWNTLHALRVLKWHKEKK